ncbi:sodium:solute symporter family transporter [Anaerohalosphaeraceae bacterium U12dextr]
MQTLSTGDYWFIAVYLVGLIGISLYLKKRASSSVENYLIGGRQLPWWALGVSGMASFFDMTGTMIIVSFLYMLGPRGLYIEFRGGAVLVLAVMMLWTGKWHRRSGVLTHAEWMIYRFGDTFGGRFARLAAAVAAIASAVGLIAYLIKGAGLFLSLYIPFSPLVCAMLMIGVATLYTLISGFYGVVYIDLFQSVLILTAVVVVSVMTVMKISSSDQLATLAYEVTGQKDWMSSSCSWLTTMPRGYEQYRYLMAFALVYLLRNVFFGLGTGGEPRYFGARSDKECCKLTFFWICLMMIRWPMMMAFAVLGLYMIKDLFPNQTVLAEAAALIKAHDASLAKPQWEDFIAGMIHSPRAYSPELMEGLQQLLGEDWATKLQLLSFDGTINPERIVPAVILYSIPVGLRGIIIVALVAAGLSTFGSIVIMAVGFFARDVYQGQIHPKATHQELIFVSWLFGAGLVAVSFLFGYSVKNINDIWDWFIMALGGGLMMPTILRFYWWRFNGGGFAIGTIVGILAAILQRLYMPEMDPRLQFVVMASIGLIASVVGAYLTEPTDRAVLEHFYRTTRPFGLWRPFRELLAPEVRVKMALEHKRDVRALPFALGWQITLFLLPMQLLIKSYQAFGITLVIFGVSLAGLYFTWLRHIGEQADK